MIKQLLISINKILSKNSSNEVFNASKYEYKTALKRNGYQLAELIFNEKEQIKLKRNRSQDIIWFNPSLGGNVSFNIDERFHNLLDTHLPQSKTFQKIFDGNTLLTVEARVYGALLKLTIIK